MATEPRRISTPDCARPASLNHDERQRLIRQPFMCRIIPGKTWGGLYIKSEPLPTEGRRRYAPTPDDEETYRVHFPEE